jgi:hypothetical protein
MGRLATRALCAGFSLLGPPRLCGIVAREEEETRPDERMRPAPRVSIMCLKLRASARSRFGVLRAWGGSPARRVSRRHSRYSLSRAETKEMRTFGVRCRADLRKDRGIRGTCRARAAFRQALTGPDDGRPTRCPPRADGGGGHRSRPPERTGRVPGSDRPRRRPAGAGLLCCIGWPRAVRRGRARAAC